MADGILKNMYGMNEEEKHIKAKQLKEQLGTFCSRFKRTGVGVHPERKLIQMHLKLRITLLFTLLIFLATVRAYRLAS
jgi:hypothetical protein